MSTSAPSSIVMKKFMCGGFYLVQLFYLLQQKALAVAQNTVEYGADLLAELADAYSAYSKAISCYMAVETNIANPVLGLKKWLRIPYIDTCISYIVPCVTVADSLFAVVLQLYFICS